MRRRKPAERTPHPNGAAELQLLEILDLRAGIGRRADLISDYRDEIDRSGRTARAEADTKLAKTYYDRARELDGLIRQTEIEISEVHQQIRELMSKLTDDDLLYLSPAPARDKGGKGA